MSWQLDPGHTYIGFTGRHLMVSTVRGEFEKFSGSVEFDEQDITRSKAEIQIEAGSVEFDEQDITRSKAELQIEAGSVNTHNAQRDEHFRSADFFDVEHYPYITFTSKRVIMQDAQHGQLVGDLTIRGITREVELDGEYSGVSQTPWNTWSAGFSLRGKVNRKDWDMKWNMVLAGGGLVAGDEITLTIDLELIRPLEVVATAQTSEVSA